MEISSEKRNELIETLKVRFERNMKRHEGLSWKDVEEKLLANPKKVWSLFEMENTGGEPDVVAFDAKTYEFVFFDCSEESPKGRRSLCFDKKALDARKENKPSNSAEELASTFGIALLSEEEYRYLQTLGKFDMKTSSWIQTPERIRKLGGALFADYRYDTVFVYHNGADSYYGARGFRGSLRV